MFSSGKGTLATVTLAAAAVIFVVHYEQVRQQNEMKKGIARDKLRVENKKKQLALDKEGSMK